MKKSLIAGVALAASLLTACGGESGTATTTGSSTTAPSSTSESPTPSSASSADSPTSDASDGSAAAVTLDEQSTTWFASFCTGFVGLKDSFTSIESDLAGATGNTNGK